MSNITVKFCGGVPMEICPKYSIWERQSRGCCWPLEPQSTLAVCGVNREQCEDGCIVKRLSAWAALCGGNREAKYLRNRSAS